MNNLIKIPRKISINNALLLYFIIFFSEDTYLFGTNSNGGVMFLSRCLLIMFCAYLLHRVGRNILLLDYKMGIYFLITLIFGFSSFLNYDSLNFILIKWLIITLAFLMTKVMAFDDFVIDFCKVIYFIAICAVIFEIVAYLYPQMIYYFPGVVGTGGEITRSCFLAGIMESFLGTSAIRVSGIFWEPGVFSIYLNFAIAFELFYKKQINIKYLVIEILAVIFTFSTTGYIVFLWQLLCYILFCRHVEKNNTMNIKILLTFLVVIIALWLTYFSTIMVDVVIAKFYYVGGGSSRIASVVANIQMALDNPFFGIGHEMAMHKVFSNLANASYYVDGLATDNTNTLLYLYAAYGIPFGIIVTIGTYLFGISIFSGRKMMALIIFGMILLLYLGENLRLSTLPFVIVFYGYQWKLRVKSSPPLKCP